VLEVAGWAVPARMEVAEVLEVAGWAVPVMAAPPAVWERERSALLVVLAAEVAATVPCHMLVAERAITYRRQTISMSVVEVISMLSDPGETSHASSRLAAS